MIDYMNTWNEANKFLYLMKVGDYYMTDSETKIECVKRTTKKIYLSNNIIITIKKITDYGLYFSSKSVRRGNKNYPVVNQVLMDIEGYLVYKKLTNFML